MKTPFKTARITRGSRTALIVSLALCAALAGCGTGSDSNFAEAVNPIQPIRSADLPEKITPPELSPDFPPPDDIREPSPPNLNPDYPSPNDILEPNPFKPSNTATVGEKLTTLPGTNLKPVGTPLPLPVPVFVDDYIYFDSSGQWHLKPGVAVRDAVQAGVLCPVPQGSYTGNRTMELQFVLCPNISKT